MNPFLKITQQTLWQILGKVATSISTFIILGLVTRTYGESGTGVFTLALTYLAIFYLLADFGFNAHELKQPKLNWQKLLGTRIIWSVFLVVLAVGLLPLWPFATSLFSQAIFYGVFAIVASAIFTTCNLIFQSRLRYDLSVVAVSSGTLLSILVFIYLVSTKAAIPFLLIAHLIGWILITVVALVLIKKFYQSISPIFDAQYSINLFKTSWPIAATLAVNVVYFRADAFLIAYFKGTADVGIYNVAYSVFQSALVLPTFIMNAYYPLMLKSLKGIKLVALGLLALALLGNLFTFFLAPLIIKLLTGGGFTGSIGSLQVLSFGFPAYFLSSLLMWLLVTKGHYKIMFLVYLIGLLINATLNFIYIPSLSFVAASWTTVISEYLILIMQMIVLFSKQGK